MFECALLYASENVEIFKIKLSWGKSSWLLQYVAYLVFFISVENTQMIYKTLKNNYMINPIDKIDMKPTASAVNGLISGLWIQIQIYISNSIVKNKDGSELKSTTK